MRMRAEVIHGDCLTVMPELIERGIKVDACITDPPYGTTACVWDSVIPFVPMWLNLKAVCKERAAIVLFGSQPFTSALVMSNPKMFKHQWVWDKGRPANPRNANIQPLKSFEDVLVFASATVLYNPQDLLRAVGPRGGVKPSTSECYRPLHNPVYVQEFYNYPKAIIKFSVDNSAGVHPTQKPVDLMRYLVRTYTNEGDTVLDFACGSGTTGVACAIEGRNFIGIEKDTHYVAVARARILRASGVACDVPKRAGREIETPLFAEAIA